MAAPAVLKRDDDMEKGERPRARRRVISKTIKIQYEIPPEKLEEIESLMVKSGIQTKKELFNNAFSLLKWVINEKEEGRTIAAIDEKEGKMKVLVMPAIDVKSRSATKGGD